MAHREYLRRIGAGAIGKYPAVGWERVADGGHGFAGCRFEYIKFSELYEQFDAGGGLECKYKRDHEYELNNAERSSFFDIFYQHGDFVDAGRSADRCGDIDAGQWHIVERDIRCRSVEQSCILVFDESINYFYA